MSRWQRPSANPNMHEFLAELLDSANGSGASEVPGQARRLACLFQARKRTGKIFYEWKNMKNEGPRVSIRCRGRGTATAISIETCRPSHRSTWRRIWRELV